MNVEYVDDNGIEVIRVLLSKSYIKEVMDNRERWACEDKPGRWGQGLVGGTVEVGLRGEMAFAAITNLPIDTEPKSAGTGGGSDFSIGGVTFEIKTKKLGSNHNHLLVRCTTETGNPLALKSDIYIAAREVSKVFVPKHEVVHLMGWTTREELDALPTTNARLGNHRNKEVPFLELRPMRELLSYLPS